MTTPWSPLAWTMTLVRWSRGWISSSLKPWRNTDAHAEVQPDRLVLPLLEPCMDAQSGCPVPRRSSSHTKHKQTLFIWRPENLCAGVTLSFWWESCFKLIRRLSDWRKQFSSLCCQNHTPEFTWKDARDICIARRFQWNITCWILKFLVPFCSNYSHFSPSILYINRFSLCKLKLAWGKY